MIDRFTEKAKEAIGLAADAAEDLGHTYVGTEHLLIGLLREGTGAAARVLDQCGVKEEKVMELVSQLITPNQAVRMAGDREPLQGGGAVQGASHRHGAHPDRHHQRERLCGVPSSEHHGHQRPEAVCGPSVFHGGGCGSRQGRGAVGEERQGKGVHRHPGQLQPGSHSPCP